VKWTAIVLTATVMILAAGGSASAQDLTGKIGFVPELGLLMPMGDFGSKDSTAEENMDVGYAKTGFGFGGALEYYFSSNLALGGKFFYNRFGFDTADFEEGTPSEIDWDAHWKVIQYGAYLKYVFTPESQTKVFGRAGVIFGKPKATITGSYAGVSADAELEVDSAVGFDAGFGIMHMTDESIGISLAVDLNYLSTDGKDVTLTAADETMTVETNFSTMWVGLKVCGVFLFGGS
jgi:opacity protein-like surface antigen